MKNQIKKMTIAGVFTALVFLLTAYLHIPVGTGYVHIGDAFIYFAASMLPLPYGLFVGIGGAVLADCLSGFAVWAPASAIIKGVAVLFFTRKSKIICVKNIIAVFLSWIVCIGGYYLYEAIITSNFIVPLASIGGNVLQCVFSTIAYIIIGISIDKIKRSQK